MSKINFSAATNTNNIVLVDDNVFNLSQHGIKYTNNATGLIKLNTIVGPNLTNTQVALFYGGSNVNSPTVSCNDVSNAYTGFEFNSTNTVTVWGANNMNTLKRGLVLSGTCSIGQQGSLGNPIGNKWTGNWTGNFGTYMDQSDANLSPMWYKSPGPNFLPPNNDGNVAIGDWYGGTFGSLNPTGGAPFNCGSGPPPPSQFVAATSSYLSEEVKYIQKFANYQTLQNDPSLISSNTVNQTFVTSLNNTSVDKFSSISNLFYAGNNVTANNLNAAITCTNSVEINYKNYYTLYNQFVNNQFTSNDSLSLINIASLCPAIDGMVVYQARALHNVIHKTAKIFNDYCDISQTYSRATNNSLSGEKINNWQISLFPNPANNFVTLVSNLAQGELELTIVDVNGKVVYSHHLTTTNHQVSVELDLNNGIYFANITNANKQKITKKLVISK